MKTHLVIEILIAFPAMLAIGTAIIMGIFSWMLFMFGLAEWFSERDKAVFQSSIFFLKAALLSAAFGGAFAGILHLYRIL